MEIEKLEYEVRGGGYTIPIIIGSFETIPQNSKDKICRNGNSKTDWNYPDHKNWSI